MAMSVPGLYQARKGHPWPLNGASKPTVVSGHRRVFLVKPGRCQPQVPLPPHPMPCRRV